ncbi:glycine betaine/L-proline ABC transporter ATP-binding protein [Pseudophaeobacter sp. EL27]|uniref:quaternary amine ABC transporter ATP-binding protein n=1 Tax=Pseudophaeobacter sp. EL27 TaxID=2107580 RepID=UPI000EFA41D5|nr:betaine/proline/choline family ABC transporter ATP-binding protein [Pseudophaeobacter sp. EL27]
MTRKTQLSIRGLYKVFGATPQTVLPHVLAGMGKAELLQKHGHVLGLQNINVDMKAGEITVVMGLSGSGKSTLIRHVNRLIEPTAGEIEIDGQNILTLSSAELLQFRQTKMSMVFQKFALFPHRTVLQNAAMALEVRGESTSEREAEAAKWLDRVGLAGFEGHYPHQLSGGMQQRVGIARALASNSDIMLMDEAFSALDPLIRTDMQNLLLELQTELHKTIVFITHDLDEALKLADHLVILKDGAVVQQGEPQEILLNPADPYIEDFVGDINRARVLRVRSIMHPGEDGDHIAGEVDQNATLESVIELSEGDTQKNYRVCSEGVPVGFLDMKELVKALVPAHANASRSGDIR